MQTNYETRSASTLSARHRINLTIKVCRFVVLSVALMTIVLTVNAPHIYGQRSQSEIRNQTRQARRLPSPERIVRDYLQASGGKRRVSAIRRAIYEWEVRRDGEATGHARSQTQSPASARIDITLNASGERSAAANARTAWTRDDRTGRTLTDRESAAARLQAALYASRFIDYKRQNILARTTALDTVGGESAYVVEFSTREGARVRCWFGQTSKLLLQTSDESGGNVVRFADYRVNDVERGVLEPHRIEFPPSASGDGEAFTLALRSVNYNPALSGAVFDPPVSGELDVVALLREVERNQNGVDERRRQYTFMQRETERQVNDRGQVREERVRIYEVYPVPGRRPVFKLMSENGVPLTGERAEREARRAAEELTEAERDRERDEQRRERERTRRAARSEGQRRSGSAPAGQTEQRDEADDPRSFTGILFRACELVSPRRERFRDRDAVVFDFRPRPGFRPQNREESIVSKLSGIMWIDLEDKQVMRFEARLTETFRIGGGLLVSMRPGSMLIVEQTRLPDGVWLPRSAQFVASIRLLLFAGGQYNVTQEWSDYRRFSTQTDDPVLNSPTRTPASLSPSALPEPLPTPSPSPNAIGVVFNRSGLININPLRLEEGYARRCPKPEGIALL